MLKFLILLSIISYHTFASTNSANDTIIIEEIRIKAHLQNLTSTPRPRNYANINSLNIAANYIDSVFRQYSSDVWIEPFEVLGNEYKNIICSFGPKDASRIIIGAHYDVCGNQPGADDNASGIAGLLELARLLKIYSPPLKNRIDLVAFSLEEPPFFGTENMGSAVYAKKLKESAVNIKIMICLEMIGYFDDRPDTQSFPLGLLSWFYPDEGNFIAVVSNFKSHPMGSRIKKKMSAGSDIQVCQLTAPSFITGIDFSDHRNFWKKGYKAVMITDTAFFRNHNYHQKSDTIDTLDIKRMAEVIKGIYLTAIQL